MIFDENRNEKRKPYQFYLDAKHDGVIFRVYKNCFIRCNSDQMKNCAAFVLGIILRT